MCVYFLGLYDISLPLPTLSQIRGHKRRHFVDTTDGEDEFEKVSKLVEELGDLTGTDNKKAFTYGVKMGVGSDRDPLIICFTSKHLLNNVVKYPGHYAVFHIDGTYKLLKNRFPVIAYGRSDSNGQMHLISVAICSSETQDTYTHFYRYLFNWLNWLNLFFLICFLSLFS